MIPGNFYPTNVTITNQNLELTNYIQNIPVTSQSFSDAYWLGWINYDNLPSIYHLSKFELNSGIATFYDSTNPENYPVGYAAGYETYAYPLQQQMIMLTNNGNNWNGITGITQSNQYATGYARLPNSLDVNCTNWNDIHIGISGLASDGTDDALIYGFFQPTSPEITGSFTVQLIKSYGSLTYNARTVTLNYDDFDDTGIIEFIDGGISHKIGFTAWYIMYLRDNTTSDSAGNFTYPKPIIQIADTTGQQFVFGVMSNPYTTDTSYAIGAGNAGNGILIDQTGAPSGYYCYNDNDDNLQYIGGFVGSFDVSQIDFNKTTVYFPDESNFIIVCYGYGTNAVLNRIYSVEDLRRTFALTSRYTLDGSSYRYENSANYLYAHVTEENEFLGELIDGTHVSDGLRDWQIVGNTITDNDFDPQDIPPYEPEPVDDGPDSGGDESRPWDFVNTPLSATNNFVTLYALSTAQVSEFGAVMWAKLSDAAFWQSVGTVFLNDFSINPADMLKYFVSLRYFPFDLSNYSATYANGIYIGRSTYPIQISTYPRRMARNLVEISGGSAQVILPAPYNTQDFRNCDPNTQVSVYVPYCGIVELSAAEVYGKYLDLRYYADMQTGALAASLCVRSDTYYEIATLAGSCGAEVPITANNNIEFLQRIATVASSGLGGTISGATNGSQLGGTPGAVAGGALGAITGSAQAMMALPPVSVHKSGNATGYATLGCDNQAHITIQISKPAVPDSFAHTNGYISNKQARIGDLSGYTEMINPDTSGIDARADELEKIKAILQTGFYA